MSRSRIWRLSCIYGKTLVRISSGRLVILDGYFSVSLSSPRHLFGQYLQTLHSVNNCVWKSAIHKEIKPSPCQVSKTYLPPIQRFDTLMTAEHNTHTHNQVCKFNDAHSHLSSHWSAFCTFGDPIRPYAEHYCHRRRRCVQRNMARHWWWVRIAQQVTDQCWTAGVRFQTGEARPHWSWVPPTITFNGHGAGAVPGASSPCTVGKCRFISTPIIRLPDVMLTLRGISTLPATTPSVF